MTSDELLAGLTSLFKTKLDEYLAAKIDEALELHVKDKVFDALRERGAENPVTIQAQYVDGLDDYVIETVRGMDFDVEINSDISAEVSVR